MHWLMVWPSSPALPNSIVHQKIRKHSRQPFEDPIPVQAPPVFPHAPDCRKDLRPNYEACLMILANTDLPEEGPVLHVVTWYIHHERVPSCIVGRLVRLSRRPWEWLQQLCLPWLPLMQPFENLAFHIVRPNPLTPDFAGSAKWFMLFLSRTFKLPGKLRSSRHCFMVFMVTLLIRRAQSIPTHLSREVVERLLAIEDVCRQRRCTAWSGRMQFPSPPT